MINLEGVANMPLTELKKRELPPLKTREEMIEIMQREVYGYLPDVPFKIEVSEPQIIERRYGSSGRFCNGQTI